MPVTKVDNKGRILLPSEIRKRLKIKPGEEFLVAEVDERTVILRKIDIRKMLEDVIEKARNLDLEKLEEEIEEEGNRIARKIFG